MLAKFRIKYKGAMPGTKRFAIQLNRAKRGAWTDAGRWWHKILRPKHFTKRGATEYGYQPRSGERGRPYKGGFRRSYTGRKLAEYGHTQPLKLTGKSQAMTRLRDVRPKPKGKGVRVVLRAPALNARYKDSNINMRDEMTVISQAEANPIIRIWNKSLERRLRRV